MELWKGEYNVWPTGLNVLIRSCKRELTKGTKVKFHPEASGLAYEPRTQFWSSPTKMLFLLISLRTTERPIEKCAALSHIFTFHNISPHSDVQIPYENSLGWWFSGKCPTPEIHRKYEHIFLNLVHSVFQNLIKLIAANDPSQSILYNQKYY